MITEPFCLDPIDPPEDAAEAEKLLCAGKCPSCEQAGAFRVSAYSADAITCQLCGFEFVGAWPDRGNDPPRRKLEAVYDMGNAAGSGRQRSGRRVSLPKVTKRKLAHGLKAPDDAS